MTAIYNQGLQGNSIQHTVIAGDLSGGIYTLDMESKNISRVLLTFDVACTVDIINLADRMYYFSLCESRGVGALAIVYSANFVLSTNNDAQGTGLGDLNTYSFIYDPAVSKAVQIGLMGKS